MKRLMLSLSVFTSLLALMFMPVALAATWTSSINQLAGYTTSRTFNVQYTVLSTEQSDFCVQLYDNGSGTGTPIQTVLHTKVNSDPNTYYGNSGSFNVTVAADNTYTYTVLVHKTDCANEEVKTAGTTSTTVDTTPPPTPTYGGKTQSGTTYTITFTAPGADNLSGLKDVQLFGSTSKTYQAGPSMLIHDFTVSDGQISTGQQVTYTYTAPDSTPRYFSVEAFDNAGNGSPVVGDPGTVVHPVVTVVTGGQGSDGAGTVTTAAAEGAAGSATGGQVQGASTGNGSESGTASNGQVNAPGSNSTKKNPGKVLGIATTHSSNAIWWYIIAAIIVVLLAGYYWFARRRHTTNP